MRLHLFPRIPIWPLVCIGLTGTYATLAAGEPVDYLREVKPILKTRCYACHGAIQQKSGLRVDTVAALLRGDENGPVLVAGKPEQSRFVAAITGDAGFRMPPEGEGNPLTATEVATIRRWVAEGARAPDSEQPAVDPRQYWSYLPVKRPAVPPASTGVAPIDAFLRAELTKRELDFSPPTDPATLLRRVHLGLTGVPPTRDELRAFLADPSDAAYERVVDRLLASPQYAERWGRHWMDVWRYSDWYGSRGINEIRYSQRHIWRWRDWIIESLHADKGYDRMLLEMLAGDELAPGDPDVIRATGFLGRNWYKFDRNVWMFETVEQTAQAFLGLTLKCCRCHDHKYDPLVQRDYYRFRAFFEPHDVRTDPLTGHLATDKDATLGPVLKEGVSFVYDKQLDAPTYLFARGDNRNPKRDEPLSPAVPAAFGYELPAVTPVKLPAEATQPYLKPAVVEGQLAAARAAVKAADDAVGQAGVALAAAEKKLTDSSGGDTAPPLTGASFADRFEKPRPDVWKTISGQWEYEQGRLIQKQVGTFLTLSAAEVKPPADFAARLQYKTLPAGNIGSVGLFFDAVDLRDCQAVYTATSAGSVQAFHRQAGTEAYPAAGIFKAPVKVNEPITLDIAARGQQLNVWVNGELSVVYTMPVPRRAGSIALWTHAGTAEFSELLIDPLPAEFRLATALAEKTRSPYFQPTPADRERAVAAARHAVPLAEKKRTAAHAELAALEARIAAERAKLGGTPDAGSLAVSAAKAERQTAVARAEQELFAAEYALQVSQQSAHANDAAKQKAIADAEKARSAASTALEKARAAMANADGNYTSFGPTYPAQSTGRRLALARWIVDPRNPRTARIAVNHIWLRHFGQALVPSVANFGLNGDQPTHPELLDWLAAELMESGWRMKPLHRLMVLSRAYRQSSKPRPAAVAIDAENRFLGRMNSRRLESEAVRDSVLHVAGQLDPTRGGPELPESDGQTVLRRSVYFRSTPNEKMQFLELFDQANPNECYRRQESVMPQQALALGNSALVLNQSRLLAERLSRDVGNEPSAFVPAAFETVLSRPPRREEITACETFLRTNAELLQSGIATPFPVSRGPGVRPPSADPQQRARENLVHVLFNHNDFVTIR